MPNSKYCAAAYAGLAMVLAACASGSPSSTELALAAPIIDFSAILNDPARTAADKADDAARKPADVLTFSKIRPGSTVLELEAGRGWYSDILSEAVGPTGKLIIQYPAEFAYGDAALKTRTDAGRLKNATITKSHFDTLAVPDASVDTVVWILGPHEVFYTPKDTTGLGDPAKAYAEIKRVLKPGGQFIAMDHAADAGADPKSTGQTIHRIDPAVVKTMAKAAGLTYVDESKVLANASDDRTKMVFDASIRRHTDQFLFRFTKPKA